MPVIYRHYTDKIVKGKFLFVDKVFERASYISKYDVCSWTTNNDYPEMMPACQRELD